MFQKKKKGYFYLVGFNYGLLAPINFYFIKLSLSYKNNVWFLQAKKKKINKKKKEENNVFDFHWIDLDRIDSAVLSRLYITEVMMC